MAKQRTTDDIARLLRPVGHVPIADMPTDRPWRESVLAFLRDHQMTQTTLAQWIGVAQSVVSNMLGEQNKGFRQRSEFVEKVGTATGLGLPVVARIEIATRRLVESGHADTASTFALQIEAMLNHLHVRDRDRS